MKKKKSMYSWMNPSLEVRTTPQYGKGVFATKSIKKNDLLIIFGGYILTRKEEEELPDPIRDIAIQIEKDFVLGVLHKNQLSNTDYVNHSCDPNAGIKGQISLVAMRNIKPGEEILFDYGTVLYRAIGAPKYELKCLCGTQRCRGKITQNDWKKLRLIPRYAGYFPYYIQEEINKLNK